MKATTLLIRQHRKVEAIFKKLESGKGDAPELLRELADDLAAHMAIEQEIFYPAVRSIEIKEDVVAESFEEHAVAELALKRLLATSPNAPSFKAKVVTLKELIEHHVEEEEEELFPAVERKMKDEQLEELGKQMKAEFESALEKGFDSLVPKSMSTTSADATNRPVTRRKNGHNRSASLRA
ncbi:MAG: hemerythrin domain-containing protein [Polyangiaceae bacterium]